MKVLRLLVFFISILYINTLYGQGYKPILKGNKEWLICTSEFGNKIYNYYYAKGDTTINAKRYTKLLGYHYNGNFLLREDTLSRKVYLLIINVTAFPEEKLLYDFGLSIGDSLFISNPISPAINDAAFYYLDSVTSSTFQNTIRRVYHLHTNEPNHRFPYTKWIEGIGSTALINTPGVLGDTVSLAELYCSSENNTTVYKSLNSDTCYSNKQLKLNALKSIGNLNIWQGIDSQLHYSNNHSASELIFYTLTGKIMLQTTLINTSGVINFSHLPSGIYIAIVRDFKEVNLKSCKVHVP